MKITITNAGAHKFIGRLTDGDTALLVIEASDEHVVAQVLTQAFLHHMSAQVEAATHVATGGYQA